jgi:hypothetical protein
LAWEFKPRSSRAQAHLYTEQPFEGHAGPERGFLPQSNNEHLPYGPQSPWLLFNVEHDPSEMYPLKSNGDAWRATIKAR